MIRTEGLLVCFGLLPRVEESVSQSLLKNKVFLSFLKQNPPFELLPRSEICPTLSSKGLLAAQ
jgi:hypothetical protein